MSKKSNATSKPGKVIRLNKTLVAAINKHRRANESWSQVINRLIGDPNTIKWTLPSKLFSTKGEASGVAVQEAARQGLAIEDIEHPIKVGEKY